MARSVVNRLRYNGTWRFDVSKSFVLNPDISMGAKMVYIAIRSFCSAEDDTAFPSSLTLAGALAINRDTVFKYVNELKDIGLITTEQRKDEKGKFTHTYYTLYDTERPANLNVSVAEKTGIGPRPCPKISDTEKPVAEKTGTKSTQYKEDVPIKEGGAVAPSSSKSGESPEAETNTLSEKRKLTDAWCAAYQEKYGRKYKFCGAKDGKAADRLLKLDVPVADLIKIAVEAWEHPELFNCQHAASLNGFDARYNEIRTELENEKSSISKQNPRNVGVAKAGPSYGEAARAKQAKQSAERLGQKMPPSPNQPPSTTGSSGV